MSTPNEQMATRLELMAAIMRHPSQLDPELFQRNMAEFNEMRLRFPSLMTDDELASHYKAAKFEMQDMVNHQSRENLGRDEVVGDWITQLEAEINKRNA